MVAALVTGDQLARYLSMDEPTDSDRDELAAVAAAVTALVISWAPPPGDDGWPEHVEFGARMLGAKVYRRRNSPAGVEAMNELGPVYVQRYVKGGVKIRAHCLHCCSLQPRCPPGAQGLS